MTSVCEVTKRAMSVREFAAVMRESFARTFGYDEIILAGASQVVPAAQLMAGDG
jgi:hypothetical protein